MVVPSLTPSTKTSTTALAAAIPVRLSVVSLVMLSVSDNPVSLAAARSGVPGASGAVVSMVTVRAEEAAEVLPAASVAVAVMLLTPSVSVAVVMLQLPAPSAVAVPALTPLTNSSIEALAAASPVTVSVVSLVRSSLLEEPVSLPAVRSSVVGAAGAVVSMVTFRALEAELVLSAASVAVTVMA